MLKFKHMTKKSFPTKETIVYGWNKTINNLGFFIGVVILVWLFSIGPNLLTEYLGDDFPITSIILGVLVGIVSIIIDMGLIKIGLDFVKKEKSRIKELFLQYSKFWKYLGGMIIYALIVLAGLILFIIPGIIWAVKYQFFGYFIVEKGTGIKESLKKSSKITKDKKWNLLKFDVLLILINFIGIVTFGIGLIFTIPTTQIAMAQMYKKLS